MGEETGDVMECAVRLCWHPPHHLYQDHTVTTPRHRARRRRRRMQQGAAQATANVSLCSRTNQMRTRRRCGGRGERRSASVNGTRRCSFGVGRGATGLTRDHITLDGGYVDGPLQSLRSPLLPLLPSTTASN